MKLKPTIKGLSNLKTLNIVEQAEPVRETAQKTEVKKKTSTSKKRGNTLPSDEYKPLFPPKRLLVKETYSEKNPSKVTRQYLDISVKRANDDLGLPNVFISMYQESEFYTGYLKGKTIHLPLEMLYEFLDNLELVSDECEKRKIEQEIPRYWKEGANDAPYFFCPEWSYSLRL